MTIDDLALALRVYQASGLGSAPCLVGAADCPLHDLDVIEQVQYGNPDVAFVFRSQEQC